MRQLNNYISEKLHINKDYKIEDIHKEINKKDFFEYLTSNDVTLNSGPTTYTMYIKSYPMITFIQSREYFVIYSYPSTNKKYVKIQVANNAYKTFYADALGFDMTDNDKPYFIYTLNNAQIIVDLLNGKIDILDGKYK